MVVGQFDRLSLNELPAVQADLVASAHSENAFLLCSLVLACGLTFPLVLFKLFLKRGFFLVIHASDPLLG